MIKIQSFIGCGGDDNNNNDDNGDDDDNDQQLSAATKNLNNKVSFTTIFAKKWSY